MSNTITIRLPAPVARWLREVAARTGIPQGRLVREQLERAMARSERRFMHLAGSMSGPRDLSRRKGFSRS